jgi:glutamine amidotransferase
MDKTRIVIIDYQLGNLFSVNQALINIGLNPLMTTDPKDIEFASAIVLPGVGAFADAMKNLESMGFIEPIKKFISSGKPFLGICLGLQLLFSESDEFENTKGLDLIKGVVRRFDNKKNSLKVPQISWNQIYMPSSINWDKTPLHGIIPGDYFYFVHSFYVIPEENVALSYTTYGDTKYVSSILKDNIFACQFHPEKSADKGLQLYKNWALFNQLI